MPYVAKQEKTMELAIHHVTQVKVTSKDYDKNLDNVTHDFTCKVITVVDDQWNVFKIKLFGEPGVLKIAAEV